MNHLLASLVAGLLLQQPFPTSPFMGHLDRPVQGETITAPRLVFAGWALNCDTGQQPAYVTLYMARPRDPLTGASTLLVIPAEIRWRLSRPDALAAVPGCGQLKPALGYHIYPLGPLPTGPIEAMLRFSDVPLADWIFPSREVHYESVAITIAP